MYRRYYQPYERFNDETHGPIDEIQENNTQEEVIEEDKIIEEEHIDTPEIITPKEPNNNKADEIKITKTQQYSSPTLFGRIKIEDILLIAVILLLLQEKVPDQMLLIILVFILCIGF